MPHSFVSKKNIHGEIVFLDSSESHHLLKVLRKKQGDYITVFDGEGSIYKVELIDCSNPQKLKAKIISLDNESNLTCSDSLLSNKLIHSQISFHLFPSLIKGSRFEWLLEKATELGVKSIHPIISERTLIQMDPSTHKIGRWEKIILSAAKQCARSDLPKIYKPVHFSEAVKLLSEKQKKIILWEREEKNILCDFLKKNEEASISLFTGPEGGWTLDEMDLARQYQIVPVLLGTHILRAETASIAAISVVMCSNLK